MDTQTGDATPHTLLPGDVEACVPCRPLASPR